MSTSHHRPTTVQIRRSRLVALVVAVAALAAVVTWAVTAFAFDGNGSTRLRRARRRPWSTTRLPPASLHCSDRRPAVQGYMSYLGQRRAGRAEGPSIMSLTPAGLAGGALGTGYALPTAQNGSSDRVDPGLDEPADAAVHEGDHEPDVRPARGRSRRAAVTHVTPGGESNHSPLLAGGRQREKMTNRTNQMTDRGPSPAPSRSQFPPAARGGRSCIPTISSSPRVGAPSRRAASGFRMRCTTRSRTTRSTPSCPSSSWSGSARRARACSSSRPRSASNAGS